MVLGICVLVGPCAEDGSWRESEGAVVGKVWRKYRKCLKSLRNKRDFSAARQRPQMRHSESINRSCSNVNKSAPFVAFLLGHL